MGRSCYMGIYLFTEQCKDGVSQGEDARDDAEQWKCHKSTNADPEEVQPHAPTRNRLRQRHFTLSF